jgi:hypothetical protein
MRYIFCLILSLIIAGDCLAQTIYSSNRANNQIVYGNALKLFLGSKVNIEVTIKEGQFASFQVVDTVRDSSRTLSIEFGFGLMDISNNSVLIIKNPFSQDYTYKAQILRPRGASYEETSTVPVYALSMSREIWPYTIDSIVLWDFMFTKK